ncbi:MAG: hypothetical protein IIC81_04765 [Chloroflexi bacterium]|nr:hypothetical protein [Chloroflexota bacterium]
MKEREIRGYERRGQHPPACNCVACTQKRLRGLERGGNPLKRVLDFLLRRR